VRWVQLVAALLAVGASALFAVQNSARRTQLSFDVGVAAWQLEQPVPIPALLGGVLVGGLVLGALPMALRSARLAARVRELESREAMVQADVKAPGAW
jgi:uncharacterized integral membrane protein